ncbi:DUF2513 domain-containing protein [Parapedobacter lycopersici]|uniref:DUF2513 domain-containing protein n=1 Tax=Parapedobacter lycopersici TaxID=1864939 RepID=UPI00214D2A50|nr:DUF2513 domain-containing protein [Parapedobacter lycopersici]
MKRDMDLIRSILLDAEENAVDETDFYMPEIPEYSEDQISYHNGLLYDSGLINAYRTANKTNGVRYYVRRLTWQGHEFLDSARNENVWNKAKETAKSKGLDLGLDVMKELLVSITRSMLFGS